MPGDVAEPGRYAPSPTGELHLGNLRTARARLAVRPLDRTAGSCSGSRTWTPAGCGPGWPSSSGATWRRWAWTSTASRWSSRGGPRRTRRRWQRSRDRTYECFCTRREIAEAASAPHGLVGRYPGTCRDLTAAERAERRRTRTPALRLRADGAEQTVHDLLHGEVTRTGRRHRGPPQRRGRGVQPGGGGRRRRLPASTRWSAATTCCPRRSTRPTWPGCSGTAPPTYAHVPAGRERRGPPAGQARRRGHPGRPGARAASTRGDVLGLIAASLGLPAVEHPPATCCRIFDPAALPQRPLGGGV